MATPLFRSYRHNQAYLLPAGLEELVPANHRVQIVNEVIDSIDIDVIITKYKGGGGQLKPDYNNIFCKSKNKALPNIKSRPKIYLLRRPLFFIGF